MRNRSNLNPYAAAYVPVSIRESRARNSVTEGSPRNYNGNIWSQTPLQITNNQQLGYANALRLSPVKNQPQPASSSCISPSRSPTPLTEQQQLMGAFRRSPVKNQPASSSDSSPPQSVTQMAEELLMDEEVDMEYLRMLFHGVCDESLLDVYNLNHGDLEDAIDMLEQLEVDEVDMSGSLPDELDFSDVSHFVVPRDPDSSEQRNVPAETSAPSGHRASSKFL